MFEQSGLARILLFLQVEPVWIILLATVSLLFVISMIRKLLKLAFLLVVVLGGVYYYIDGEATAFWAGRQETLQQAIAEAGHDAVERGLALLEEVADGDLVQGADELKQELQAEGGVIAERALRLLEEGADDELIERAFELKKELGADSRVAAERILELLEGVPDAELVKRATELRRDLEETLHREGKTESR